MNQFEPRQRPSDAEFDAMIASTRTSLIATLRSSTSPWWRRSTGIALGVTLLAGGGTATALALTDDSPAEAGPRTGRTTIELGKPEPTDKYVNVTFTWRCNPGANYTLIEGGWGHFYEFCEDRDDRGKPERRANYVYTIGRDILLDGGSLTLVLKSTLTEPYEITAAYGARPILPAPGVEGTTPEELKEPYGQPPAYDTNEYGLTVGNPTIDTAPDDWPDLMPVELNGQPGYLRTDDPGYEPGLQLPDVERLKAIDEARRKAGLIKQHGKRTDYYRFVYAADGKTILGKLYVGTSS